MLSFSLDSSQLPNKWNATAIVIIGISTALATCAFTFHRFLQFNRINRKPNWAIDKTSYSQVDQYKSSETEAEVKDDNYLSRTKPVWEAKQGQGLVDIEDLIGKSLIPLTLKTMAKNGMKPYTNTEKGLMVADLESVMAVPSFKAHVRKYVGSLIRTNTKVLQLNIGFYCNQACSHCHVDSSPKRKEMMTRDVAQKCVDIARNSPSVTTVDLTGGAPELNREFHYLVKECRALGLEIIDRCNLTVLLEPHQQDLPDFLAKNQVHVIASLPCYLENNVATQRGDQVFERSIKGLQMLNAVGYGKEGTGLALDLVYNPTDLCLPPPRIALEGDYKKVLMAEYGISFNALHCITNMPINRFYDYLVTRGELGQYMDILVRNFNSEACSNLMCRTYVSIDPHGYVFDCDFNQQLNMYLQDKQKTQGNEKNRIHVSDINCTDDLLKIDIRTKKHCFGCTAGFGSS